MKVIMPAWAVSTTLIMGHVYWGVGYLIGPPRLTSSATLKFALQAAPPKVWGAMFLSGAFLTAAAPWLHRAGSAFVHLLAAAPLLAFTLALLAAEALGVAQAHGSPSLFAAPVTLHALLVSARYHPEVGRV